MTVAAVLTPELSFEWQLMSAKQPVTEATEHDRRLKIFMIMLSACDPRFVCVPEEVINYQELKCDLSRESVATTSSPSCKS